MDIDTFTLIDLNEGIRGQAEGLIEGTVEGKILAVLELERELAVLNDDAADLLPNNGVIASRSLTHKGFPLQSFLAGSKHFSDFWG